MPTLETGFYPGVEAALADRSETDGLSFRDVTPQDAEAVGAFLVTHGRTPDNPLPDPFVRRHVASIATGHTRGVLAELAGAPVGVFTYELERGGEYGEYQPAGQEHALYGYLAEAVVQPGQVRGLGTALTEAALHKVRERGAGVAYSIHNTNNTASGRMMTNNGMKEVAVLDQTATRGRKMAIKQKVLTPQA